MDKHTGDDEGADFLSAFKGAFGRATPETKKHLGERLKAERRAGRTPKERSRGGKGLARPVQINFRASKETQATLKALADSLDCSIADVIEQAVFGMAKANKVGVNIDA